MSGGKTQSVQGAADKGGVLAHHLKELDDEDGTTDNSFTDLLDASFKIIFAPTKSQVFSKHQIEILSIGYSFSKSTCHQPFLSVFDIFLP